MKIPERGRPFLSPAELRDQVERWRKAGAANESKEDGYNYEATRYERAGNDYNSIEQIHGESFIRFIEDLIKKRTSEDKPFQRVKILDVGGGAGFYAEQLRNKFGDKVEVFTTGLSKKAAQEARRRESSLIEITGSTHIEEPLSQKLHPNDLKWRSILQLRDYPEFDLIIDTFGEYNYSVKNETDSKKYLQAVASKLKGPGSRASILLGSKSNDNLEEIKDWLLREYKVKAITKKTPRQILSLEKLA